MPRPSVAPGDLAIVTGASSGLGRAFALALAARGFPVLAVARRLARLESLADEARAQGGARIVPFALDVTAPDAGACLADAVSALGPVGWLVNNAGSGAMGRFDELGPGAVGAEVRLDCEAPVRIAAALLPAMVARRSGIVLNVGSMAGLQPTPGYAVYGAAKAFIVSWTEALYEELRGTGVGATVICPGPVTTEFFAANGADGARKPPPHELAPEVVVAQAIAAAQAGKVVVVPGRLNRLLALSARYSPRGIVRLVAARTALRYVGLPPLPPRAPRVGRAASGTIAP